MAAIYSASENWMYTDDNLVDFIDEVVLDNYHETFCIRLLGDSNAIEYS